MQSLFWKYAIFNRYKYVIDPHTSVAFSILPKLKLKLNSDKILLISSTADFGKFPNAVFSSLINEEYEFDRENYTQKDLKDLIGKLKNEINGAVNSVKMHPALEDLFTSKETRERNLIDADYDIIKERFVKCLEEWK